MVLEVRLDRVVAMGGEKSTGGKKTGKYSCNQNKKGFGGVCTVTSMEEPLTS